VDLDVVDVVEVEFVVVELSEEVVVGSEEVVVVVVDDVEEVVDEVVLVVSVRLVADPGSMDPESACDGSELAPMRDLPLPSPPTRLGEWVVVSLVAARFFTKRLRAAWSRRLTPPEA